MTGAAVRSAAPVAKAYWCGTQRAVDPDTTLERVEPHWERLGITRLAGLTGLDRVGIPVFVACRPDARSLAVSQGKGLTDAAARASAVMEALELWHAEQPRAGVVRASLRDLGDERVVDVERLPRSRAGTLTADLAVRWVHADSLAGGGRVWVPYELVHADYTLPDPDPHHCFAASTNGLASGNCVSEALLHGLCELIERDATTLWQLEGARARERTALDLDSVDDAPCREVIARIERAGIDVVVWDATSDVGVAAFYALVVDRERENGVPEFGAGCHPDRAIALLRALTEAVQARTTFISGARDDFDPDWYARGPRRRRWQACRAFVDAHRPVRVFADVPQIASPTFDEDLTGVCARLREVGIGEPVAVDLSDPTIRIPVFRVLAAGLEGPYRGPGSDHVAGERAGRLEP